MRISLVILSYSFLLLANAAVESIDYQYQTITIAGRNHQARIPQGYTLELLTTKLDRPRMFAFAPNGDLFIGSKSGAIYRLAPPYTKVSVFVTLDGYPHSVAFRKNEMFIATTAGLYHSPYFPGQTHLSKDSLSLLAALPDSGGHNSRTVAVGPDQRIYISLGIAGNCSDQYLSADYPFDDRRGGVLVLIEGNSNKTHWKTFASGLRNPVGFDWHPLTKQLFATNNGPDHMGYDMPPEYFSMLEADSFHGMPWFQYDGEKIIRDNCISRKPPLSIEDVVAPVVTFPARNAPMGVSFVKPSQMDEDFEEDAIVALHGSWAKKPDGGYFGSDATRRHPKLVIVRFDKGHAQRVDDLVTGLQLENGDRWARPVGVAIGPDGNLYFTSDGGVNGLFRLRKQ